MFTQIKTRKLVEAVTLSAGLLFAAGSASAATVTVDGNLADLISAVGSATVNKASGTDPLGSADSPTTESNSGYDIKDVYAYYNSSIDTLYLGMNFYGNVGDSLDKDSAAPCERTMPSVLCSLPNNNRSIFDANETYRFSIFRGTDTSGTHLLQYYVLGNDSGSDSGTTGVNPYGLTVTHVVSESLNGVEFGITGLWTTGAITGFPSDLFLFYGAGSGDPNPTSAGAEDSYTMGMTVVPVPAAAWLFGSGLLGLLGLARRKLK